MGTFKGFKVVSPTGFTEASADKDILYLVRTSGEKGAGTDGYLYFNHKKYGTAADAKAALITRYGDIKIGEKEATISEYVAEQLKDIKGVTKDAFDALTGRVDTLETVVGNDNEGLVKSVADNAAAIAKLNNDENTDGSVKNTVAGAVSTAKADLIGSDTTPDTIKYAEKLANDAKDAADVKLASIEGADAIAVSEVAGKAGAKKQTVSLALDNSGNVTLSQSAKGLKAEISLDAYGVKGVAEGDKVIAVNGDGVLSSTISFSVDEKKDGVTERFLRLKGIDGADLGSVNIAEFVKDGMLDSASLVEATVAAPINEKTSGEFIKLTWNTDAGKDAMYIDVSKLIDTYTATGDGLVLNDHAFSLDYSVVAKQSDIATAKNELIGEDGTAKTIAAVEKELTDFSAATIENAVTLKIEDSDNYLQATKTKDKNEYTIASKGIDDAISTATKAVKVSVNGATYVTGAVDGAGRVITLSETVQAVKDASDTAKGLAEASDVKKYVDDTVADKVAEKNVAATGDTLVSASAADNKVTVAATTALTSAVEKANSAVQKVNEKSGTAVTLDDSDIALSAAISDQAKGTKVNAVLADIYSKIGLVKVSSTNKTITVDTTGRIVDVNTESVANAQAAGHVALEHGDDGALYGVMYYSGDDAE